ncbi:uncharacterized protein G2W53_038406 [Senna tora]|uniref:Uncharacterized protein n=1 Tax=Senna tora TaxID=362788 RepID=A0A834SKV1_9FABA|nr:uncharacterized protein G2W53_038406 [Senna tora]
MGGGLHGLVELMCHLSQLKRVVQLTAIVLNVDSSCPYCYLYLWIFHGRIESHYYLYERSRVKTNLAKLAGNLLFLSMYFEVEDLIGVRMCIDRELGKLVAL